MTTIDEARLDGAAFDGATLDSSAARLPQFADVARMEGELGSPEDPARVLSFAQALATDEREELPHGALGLLRELGWHRYCVPAELGGGLRWCEQFLMQARVLARRDLTVAISQSTQLWSVLVWLGGDAEQRRRLADEALRGEVIPCLAYSERDHGADLTANDLTATTTPTGYVLDGSKWPINRAVTSTHAILLARTAPGRDGRSQSLFLVRKAELPRERIVDLPRVAVYGLRGCDISGIGFESASLAADSRIGAEGEGLELALRGLLITRTFCGGLSLGAADTMLRVVTRYLRDRRLYDGPATDIPHVRETLANAYLSLLIAECIGLVAARGLHLFPAEASTWSSLAKVQSTRLVDDSSRNLARVLGARYYMRAEGPEAIFQKMLRDSAVVSLFDGSEPVCLDALAAQLPLMARARKARRGEEWSALYDFRVLLEDFRPERVVVFGRGEDAVLASLPALEAGLAALVPDRDCRAEQLARLREGVARLRHELDDLFAEVEGLRVGVAGAFGPAAPTTSTKRTSARMVRLATALCGLHAKVVTVGVWLHNRDHLGPWFASGAWLEAALHRASAERPDPGSLTPAMSENLFDRLVEQLDASRYFSILPLDQAPSPQPA
ncbi:acyl-CoA dehydrogenase family protein [Sinomonas sp. JGH33]|uniref:Acyl-CoA dehydrogenase family protein n=1 Tax=Sinomonas terricola TaxID=3110330 RepID=A0ABU5T695_9MICC|nr:acyl-CoA dehydrogenase family protein [Sinomonas sp. JGH33]MEA5455190.1 acyl-CoA dehydrogenase family protein [Sinomonas sp. JGH33]